jgi:hypothetical protein
MSKISVMPASGTLDGTEKLPLVKDGSNVAVTVEEVKNYATPTLIYSYPNVNLQLTGSYPNALFTPTLDADTPYTVEILIMVTNGNTDGIQFLLSKASLTGTIIFNIVYTTSTGVTGLVDGVNMVSISDATGISFIKIEGLVLTDASGTLPCYIRNDEAVASIIPATTVKSHMKLTRHIAQ